ncbi:hypothetical protein D9M71_817490 [compost metagenome]
MPKAVIDLLEAVNIQHQHRQTFVAIDGRLQALIEQQSVRQASNGVVMCQALQLRLRLLEFAVAQVDQVVAAIELGDEYTE